MEKAFNLPFEFVDPDLMVQEDIWPTSWDQLSHLGLKFIPASADEIAVIVKIKGENRSLSFYDAAALELAKRLDFLLLTDDHALSKVARKHAVRVEGITWVLNEMVTNKCISGREAITALEIIDLSGHAIREAEMAKWKKVWAAK